MRNINWRWVWKSLWITVLVLVGITYIGLLYRWAVETSLFVYPDHTPTVFVDVDAMREAEASTTPTATSTEKVGPLLDPKKAP